MSNIKINVLQHHIEQGECKSPQRCAIAAAIKEEFEGVDYVAVRTNGITITSRKPDGSGYRWHYAVPARIARAIIAFDSGEPIEPFSFNAKAVDVAPIKPLTREKLDQLKVVHRARRARLKMAGISKQRAGRVAGV